MKYIMLITLENLESYVNKIPQFVFLSTLITCLIAKYQVPVSVDGRRFEKPTHPLEPLTWFSILLLLPGTKTKQINTPNKPTLYRK